MRDPNESLKISKDDDGVTNMAPTESETSVVERSQDQRKEEILTIPTEKYFEILKPVNDERKIDIVNINPLYFEIGPFPRRPQRVWVHMMGLHPVTSEGDPLVYDNSRNDFVRIVFGIVFIMLLATCGLCFMCNYITPIKNMYLDPVIRIVILVCSAVLTISMAYAFSCSACTRTFPCNVICLCLTVIGFSGTCAWFVIRFNAQVIILAVITTTVIVLLCLGLACTSFDFTKFILIVMVAMAALCVISLGVFLYCYITKERLKPLHIALLVIGTLLHSVVLIIELQMVLGGKTVELSTDDYSLGAFMIYTSIITIFMKMMQLMNLLDE